MVDGFESRILICEECNEEFAFTIAAQQYFAERGYSEDPKRCKACYTSFKKSQRGSKYNHDGAMESPEIHEELPG